MADLARRASAPTILPPAPISAVMATGTLAGSREQARAEEEPCRRVAQEASGLVHHDRWRGGICRGQLFGFALCKRSRRMGVLHDGRTFIQQSKLARRGFGELTSLHV